MSIDIEGLMAQLVGQSEAGAQMRELEVSVAGLSAHAADTLAEALKRQVDKYVREKDGIPRAEGFVALLRRLSELTGNALHRGLGLRAEGNVHLIGLREYAQAIALYDAAAEIYEHAGCELEAAQALVGKVGALALWGHYDEASAVFEKISPIFEARQQWLLLAGVALNLGAAYTRLGEDATALSLYDRASELLGLSDTTGAAELLAIAESNRATALYYLGQFEAAIQASQRAYKVAVKLGASALAARAQQTLGFLYFLQGRSTEALDLLACARDFFLADQRHSDAVLVELDASYCLLHLRNFNRVLNKSLEVRRFFASSGQHTKEAQAILNTAIAYAGRREYEKSLAALGEAGQLYEAEGNQVWAAVTDLEKAAVLYWQEDFEASLATAQSCATLFQARGLPVRAAQAHLMAARAAAKEQPALARRFVSDALAVSESNELLGLTYQGRHLLGHLAYAQGAWPVAEAEYRAAIEVLERLCGQVMTEFRADFLSDKQDVYGDMVGLLLDGGKLAQAFTYVERAKSRALLDLLAYQLDLSLHPKVAADAPLVADLVRLQGARNQLLRGWQSQRLNRQEGPPGPVSEQQQNLQALLGLEQQITEGWHQLLIRNADYARQATLWQPRAEPVQPYLPQGTALLEYFPVGQNQKLCAFVVTPDSIQVCFLPATLSQIGRAFKKLQKLNLNKVPRSRPARVAGLAANAQGLLHQLYGWLIAPLRKQLAAYPRLIIVPHDTLHYLPFHALYDGASFLIETHEISYLPSASLLRYCQEVTPAEGRNVVLGYSNQNHLPHAVSEARTIAGLLEGELLLEEEATLARLQEIAPQCALLHLATHGEFREDNPLFSGLTLADGSLTTLDIFNLRLRASLVTLSACQTGKHKIGGGDELLGLTRAFLYAGAASLLLSHWKVADNATAQFMETFYQQLGNGATNSAALRYAQLQFLRPDDPHPAKPYAHPYFWASFFLIGDTRTVCT